MVLILLSIIVAAIAVAISIFHFSFGSLTGSGIGKQSIVREGSDQPAMAGPKKQFLVVVLPDGKVVNPMAADRF